MEWFMRSKLILGESMEVLFRAKVVVVGIGGVGSAAAEAIARAGVGKIVLVDHDTVNVTNINRQLLALHSTVGRKKVEVMKERILDINPNAKVQAVDLFYGEGCKTVLEGADYVIDAIDTVSSKLQLIEDAKENGIPIISAMGTGNKLDPTALCVSDLYETSVCPLCRVMRHELKKRRIGSLRVVYSKEIPQKISAEKDPESGKMPVGSVSFVPPAAGMILAGQVIRDLTKK